MKRKNHLRSVGLSAALFCLSCVLVFAVITCQKRKVEYSPPITQTYKGFEISVLSAERAGDSWKDDLGVFEHKAKQGEEIIVIHMILKPLDAKEELEIKRIELHGVDGSKGNTSLTGFTIPLTAGEYTEKIAFRMPKGTKLKTFQIEDILFDLQ